MVRREFKKSRVSNVGKLVLAFSIFCAQLAPINQAAYAIGELSTIYKFAKIDANRFETTKMIFNVNAGEPLILAWQAFLAPNKVLEQPREILPKETCKLISTNGEAITYGDGLSSRIWESSQANKYDFYFAPLNTAYFVINSPISTELELKCIWHKVLSEGTLKVSRYIPSGKEIYSLPKGGSIEIKAGENKFLTFQGKAGKQLTFKMEATKVSLCYVTSASEPPSITNDMFNWDDATLAKFGGKDARGKNVNTIVKQFTPTKTGTFVMVCNMDEGLDYGTITIVMKNGDLKLIGPQAFLSETTSPAKCPVDKGPSAAPKISVASNGLFIQYSEPGFSDLAGCIDGFRVYTSPFNPFTQKVGSPNGTWSVQIKDCEKSDNGLITCLIPNEKEWLKSLNVQNKSSGAMAINASAVNSKGESEFSRYTFLFESESPLISAACIAMQTSFATTAVSVPALAFVVGEAAAIYVSIKITKGTATPVITKYIVRAGAQIAAAQVAKSASKNFIAYFDKNAAKKFVKTYPIHSLEVLISMENSLNPDVRAKSKYIEKAILASDLKNTYRTLIGEGKLLTSLEVTKILADETLSIIKEKEQENFERNGTKELESLAKKNSSIKLKWADRLSIASKGLTGYLSVTEQIQNDKTAFELVLPSNCNF